MVLKVYHCASNVIMFMMLVNLCLFSISQIAKTGDCCMFNSTCWNRYWVADAVICVPMVSSYHYWHNIRRESNKIEYYTSRDDYNVYVLAHSEHNTRKTKKKENCHSSLRWDTLSIQYDFFDYTCETSSNSSLLTTIQAMGMIMLSTNSMNDVDTDIMVVYNTIHSIEIGDHITLGC